MKTTLSYLCSAVVLSALTIIIAPTTKAQAVTPGGNTPVSPSDKPRVFVTDSSSWEEHGAVGGSSVGFGGASSGGARPQTAEIIKTFGQRCDGVIINSHEQASDYVVELDHEGGKGLLSHKDKVAVFVRTTGDSIFSKSTLSVGGSVQEACDAILAHWAKNAAELRNSSVPAPPVPVAPPIAASAAHLNLTSNPDHADIEINGSFVGNTPSSIDLEPGEQNIVISKRGFTPWTRKIKLTGGSISVYAELDPSDKAPAP